MPSRKCFYKSKHSTGVAKVRDVQDKYVETVPQCQQIQLLRVKWIEKEQRWLMDGCVYACGVLNLDERLKYTRGSRCGILCLKTIALLNE